ncbi:uncharacterized protein LOC130780429 [Actinidia eriantha]|uniref:uncharacterized protein LOC130780429 n=1 Tax=Actinidia eriantha TaxID=165200 RepID=UPI002587527F|nr:uncharacterized protein LOC130780429 [Actinidia eriantha]
MGLNSKKEKQSPSTKEATSPKLWPDLPSQVITTIARQSPLMNNISYGGVTKSWRVQPSRCNATKSGKSPIPQLYGHRDSDQSHPDTFNISFRQGSYWWHGRWRRPSQYPCVHFVGYSNGRLIARGYEPSQYYLWNPVQRSYSQLPHWDTTVPLKHVAIIAFPFKHVSQSTVPVFFPIFSSFRHVGLSSLPKDHDHYIVMVLTGIHHPAFVFLRYTSRGGRDTAWSKQDCTLVDPNSSHKQLMQFTNAIGFKGKFYALSLQGTLAVLEYIDSEIRITGLSTKRAVPNCVPSMHFKEYLMESNGEVLLVLLISRKSIHRVENVEVHRLQLDGLSWEKMESLGDRTLFVGTNCCMSVIASELGCRRNCIYFTHQTEDGWWVYDLERESISPNNAKSLAWDELEA